MVREAAGAPDTLTSDITGVEDLVDLLRAIDDDLDPKDGVRAFNHLYLRVTELVNDRMTDGYFTNPRFVARLDIRFASLYLEALPARCPPRPGLRSSSCATRRIGCRSSTPSPG